MQRFKVLRTAVAMLPGRCKEDHSDSILRRHHAAEFSPRFMAARISDCLQQYPSHSWTLDAGSTDYILVFYGGAGDPSLTLNLPCFMPFAGYMRAYIASAPTFGLPELGRVVYPIQEADSIFHSASMHRYVADGSWMDVQREGHLRLLHDAAVLCVNTVTDAHVLLHGAHGLHAVIQADTSAGSTGSLDPLSGAALGEKSTAVDGSAAVVRMPVDAVYAGCLHAICNSALATLRTWTSLQRPCEGGTVEMDDHNVIIWTNSAGHTGDRGCRQRHKTITG